MKSYNIPYHRLSHGFSLCLSNAERLLADAKILRDNKRFPTSIVCGTIGFEELGKALFYREKRLRREDVTKADYQSFLRHKEKAFAITKYVREKTGNSFCSSDAAFHDALKDIESRMTDFEAEERSVTEKERYLYVNWTLEGWKFPTDPTVKTFISKQEEFLKKLATRRIQELQRAIEYVREDDNTRRMLSEGDREPANVDYVEVCLKADLKMFDHRLESIQVEFRTHFGEIKGVHIRCHDNPLTDEEKKFILSDLGTMVPGLARNRVNIS